MWCTLVWLTHCSVQSLFHCVQSMHSCPHAADDADVIGERVLREARDDRELKARMREIEDELAHLMSVRIHEVSQSLSSYH